MPNLNIPRNYSDGNDLLESHLDDALDAVETLLNTTKLDTDNVQAAGIETANIADNAVTRAKLESVGQQVSSLISFSTDSTSTVDVTNATVTITTTGRPVMVMLMASGTSGAQMDLQADASTTGVGATVELVRGSTVVSSVNPFLTDVPASTTRWISYPPCLSFLDTPSAGTYTYKLQCSTGATTTLGITNARLVAYEL